jgi:hypothetical protein
MPPKVKQTAEEVQAEIDADPFKLVHNPTKKPWNQGANKNIELTTEAPMIADSWTGDGRLEV